MRGRFDFIPSQYNAQSDIHVVNTSKNEEKYFNYKTSINMDLLEYPKDQNENIHRNKKQENQCSSYPKMKEYEKMNMKSNKNSYSYRANIQKPGISRNFIDKRNNMLSNINITPFNIEPSSHIEKAITKNLTEYPSEDTLNNIRQFKTLNDLLIHLQQKHISLNSYLQTQKGSRNVQKLLFKITPTAIDNIIIHLSPIMHTLMRDKYGNYFCSKLIQNCSPEQRVKILQSIKQSFGVIGNCIFGTHCIQIMVELSNMKNEQELLGEYIRFNIINLCCDQRGTHIVQKFIANCIDENTLNTLCRELLSHFDLLMNNPHGVCVYIKIIKIPNLTQIKYSLCDIITKNPLKVIRNPYGNYLIQSILEVGVYDIALSKGIEIIKQEVILNFVMLSMQKYSSNVVEKTLMYIQKENIMEVILQLIEDNSLELLLENTYGKYVIEKVLMMLEVNEKTHILNTIKDNNKDKQYFLISVLMK